MIIKSTLELLAILLLIYGFINEDKVIKFEEDFKLIVVVLFRRIKRKLSK